MGPRCLIMGAVAAAALAVPAARAQCFEWSDRVGLPGADLAHVAVLALVAFDDGSGPALLAGGFIDSSTSPGWEYVMRWDGSGWQAFPGVAHMLYQRGFSDMLAHAGPGGIPPGLYLASEYELFRFDGQGWSVLGHFPGTWDAGVFVLELFDAGAGDGAHLFAGGGLGTPFTDWGVIEWDGSTWRVPGGGVRGGAVYELAVHDDGSGAALHAGGGFHWAGSVIADNIARWDGSAWQALGSGTDGEVRAIQTWDDGSGGRALLCVAGKFRNAGGVSVPGLALWDGATWSPLGQGLDGEVRALGVFDDGTRRLLVASGSFSHIGGVAAEHVAAWDGTSWMPLGSGLERTDDGASAVLQFDEGAGSSLWVGGRFLAAGGKPSAGTARWRDECPCSPRGYCTAKSSSLGCLPAIGWSGSASASSPTPFLVTAAQIHSHSSGLLFYGLAGWLAQPFQGGVLCVAPPLRRTPAQASAGNPPPPDCSGTYTLDFNAWIQGGSDPGLVAGREVHGQYWYRDPASPGGAGLSDAIAFSICL